MENRHYNIVDGIRMDSHKLIYHVERVYDWLNGREIFPIYLDVSPTSACNHKCVFCGLDYIRKQGLFLDYKFLKAMLLESARYGLKSVVYAGEGEPLLHKNICDIIAVSDKAGVDSAIATNAVLMSEGFLKESLKHLKWIRISIDAGSSSTYEKLHNANKEDFKRVLENLASAVKVKKNKRLNVTIGAQFLLLKENEHEVLMLAKKLEKIGIDYLSVKPYSKHPLSINNTGTDIDYSTMVYLDEEIKPYSKKGFKVIFRKDSMLKRLDKKLYKRCYGAPFWAYVCADGEVYPCHTFLGLKRYSFGNIYNKTFHALWTGDKRKKIMKYMNNKMDTGKCRELCRLNEINTYLWELKNPHPHVNFI